MRPASLDIRSFGDELLTGLLHFAVHSISGAVGAGINIAAGEQADNPCLGPDSGTGDPEIPRSVAAVGVACQLDPAQWAQARGPLWDAFRTGRLVQLPAPVETAAAGGPGIDFGALAGAAPPVAVRPPARDLASLAGVGDGALPAIAGAVFSPGEWGGELPVILSIYLDRPADASTLRSIDRYEPVITQALSVVEYCAGEQRVAQQMLQMTQYRRVIEQAKGLVMGAAGGDAGAAFATLARASQHFNIRLRHLAVALVEHVGGGRAEHPEDPALVITPSPAERQIASRVWAALTAPAGHAAPHPTS